MQSRTQSNPSFPPRLPLPDPMLAREALREVRHAVHIGIGLARDTVGHAPLPEPVAAIAGTVLRKVDRLAHQAEAAAATVARGIFGGESFAEGSLSEIEAAQDADRRFAAAAYAALQRALAQLDATELRVSEAVARDVHRRLRSDAPRLDDVALAATLMRGLLEARVIRGALPIARGDRGPEPATVVPVAVFAVMLWFLSDRAPGVAALTASVVLACALADEIRAAGSDPDALAQRLFAEFKDRV